MLKQYKSKLIASSAVVLLPIILGLCIWSKLPELIPIHWGLNGTADSFGGRGMLVFVLPLILLAFHWLTVIITSKDPKNKNMNGKVFSLIIWIIPFMSLIVNGSIYAITLGMEFSPLIFINALLGIAFIAIGNYLPKCKQNFTVGIKVKWTLENEENWNATHRIAGKVWFVGGALLLISMLLGKFAVPAMIVIVAALAIIPIIYSYLYHKKQLREGTAVITPIASSKAGKAVTKGSTVFAIAVVIIVAVMMFTGKVVIAYGENSFTLSASMWTDLTVDYDSIDTIEYRDSDNAGSRTAGIGSARILAGSFRNDEFGTYTRYSYANVPASVVLTVGEKTLVIGGADTESTRAIYETLLEKTN